MDPSGAPIYLAIDIGASSGRFIAAQRQDGELVLQEVYRFENCPQTQGSSIFWDLDDICGRLVEGLSACRAQGIVPRSLGVDTWGVDYVLLDEGDRPILPVYCYRDGRGARAMKAVHARIPPQELYARTGIQLMSFNTLYQLYDDREKGRLAQAADLLMIPEYLNFFLCGKKRREYTNASTTGLLDPWRRCWDEHIIRALDFPEGLFAPQPERPPVSLGRLRSELAQKAGFSCDVLLIATHDTASAVASLPGPGAYISSGTWSLLGTEIPRPLTGSAARRANFTNEGGTRGIRFLKNIMGLWMAQCLKRELGDVYSYAQLTRMAEEEADFDYRLEVDREAYFAPQSIRAVIREECARKGWPVPQTPGQFAHAIYQSLAHAYAQELAELEALTGQHFDSLCIMGGGVNNDYLNRLTEQATGKKVVRGAAEATALGNILLQEEMYV